MVNNQHLQCIKSLYKSTYKKNAFTKNKKYQIEFEEICSGKRFFFIRDNCDNLISFIENKDSNYYLFNDYFKVNLYGN